MTYKIFVLYMHNPISSQCVALCQRNISFKPIYSAFSKTLGPYCNTVPRYKDFVLQLLNLFGSNIGNGCSQPV